MRGMLAVAAREVRERRVILLAAPAFGLLPVILPRLDVIARLTRDPGLALHLTGALLVSLPTALALGLGASALGRDVGERRLGFYFSRPLAGIEIWAGKILAVLAMLAISVLLLPLPVLLLGDRGVVVDGLTRLFLGREGPPRWALPLWLAFVTSVSAAVSVALRARSGLLVFDIAGAALVSGTIGWAMRTLIMEGAGPGISPSQPPVAMAVVTLILLAATAAQVTLGRSDARRGHAALSSVAWSGLGLGALAFFLYTQWLLGVQPRDLSSAWISTPSLGESYVVTGRSTRGEFMPTFLLDASGRSVQRLSGFGTRLWARDGSRLFWLDANDLELRTAWLSGTEAGISRTPLRLTAERQRYLWLQDVSPDGRRVLAATGDVVLVLDPQSGAELGSAPLSGWKRGVLTAPDRARLLVTKNAPRSDDIRIAEVDFAQGRAVDLGRLDLGKPTNAGLIAVSPGFDRVLVDYDWTVGGPHPGLTLHAVDGRRIATIPVRASRDFTFLSDGRIAVADRGNRFAAGDSGDPSGLRIRVLAPDGTLRREASLQLSGPLARQGSLRLNGEPSSGQLSVCLESRSPGRPDELQALFVDTESLELRRREPGLSAAPGSFRQSHFGRVPAPGSIQTRLFTSADKDIVWFDPATGEKRLLIDIAAEKDPNYRR